MVGSYPVATRSVGGIHQKTLYPIVVFVFDSVSHIDGVVPNITAGTIDSVQHIDSIIPNIQAYVITNATHIVRVSGSIAGKSIDLFWKKTKKNISTLWKKLPKPPL